MKKIATLFLSGMLGFCLAASTYGSFTYQNLEVQDAKSVNTLDGIPMSMIDAPSREDLSAWFVEGSTAKEAKLLNNHSTAIPYAAQAYNSAEKALVNGLGIDTATLPAYLWLNVDSAAQPSAQSTEPADASTKLVLPKPGPLSVFAAGLLVAGVRSSKKGSKKGTRANG